ncbi:gephyrin-like molybdotransferase Glp [Armatimonas sp.]|uniref:molybdopterin molybdotransferase MoeA n=1 Tax=Armatimonas sp. TaxID=1872638 RepID=UPI0037513074
MQSYDEALAQILASATVPLATELVPLEQARGRAVASDILATCDLPPFDNSMVDGYAVRTASVGSASEELGLSLPITMEIPAGSWPTRALRAGEAARIFTGAPIPEGCDAVVMVEDTEEAEEDDENEPGRVTLRHPGSGSYIRRRGSDIAVGGLAIPAGTSLRAGEIGLLAALGIAEIPCPRRPRVGILSTGDELISLAHTALQPGQIRDSNGPALAAAIEEAGGVVVGRAHAKDTPEAVAEAFAKLSGCDLIIASGGVSVGDHDHVKAVLEAQGTLSFWRIAIKPGKPLAFGTLGDALFFGLPGNPVSSLVTFELFVRPLLRKLAGHTRCLRSQITITLATPLSHAPGRREFVRASLDDNLQATPTGAQGSHRTSSMVGADVLIIAHEHHGDYPEGTILPALVLR